MSKIITLTLQDGKQAQALLTYLKTLDFVKIQHLDTPLSDQYLAPIPQTPNEPQKSMSMEELREAYLGPYNDQIPQADGTPVNVDAIQVD